MKKADAIKSVIEAIKADNRTSFNRADIEAFKMRYSGRLTTGLILDFQAAAAKAGIEAPEKLDFEDLLPKKRTSFLEEKAGVGPGKQLRTNVTGLPEAEIKKLGVVNPISINDDGAKLLLKNMQRTGLPMQGAFVELADTLQKYSIQVLKTQGADASDAFYQRVDSFFPDGLLNVENRLNDARAYEQLLYEEGYLEDADPPTGKEKIKGKTVFTFEGLDEEFNEIPESGRNRRSRKGKEILDIKEKGGVPAVIGRDVKGKLIYHPTKVIPYKLKLSEKGIEHVKNFKIPEYISTQLPKIYEPSKSITSLDEPSKSTKSLDEALSEQRREDRRKFYQSQRVPTGDMPPLANPVTSKRTGKTYDNYNQMVAQEGRPPAPTRTSRLLESIEETDKSKQLELPFSERSLSDEQKSKRTKDFLNFIESGGRKALKTVLPFGTGALLAAVPSEGEAAPLGQRVLEGLFGSTRLADATPGAAERRREREYDRRVTKREELIPPESEVRGRTMEEVKSRTSFMNQ